MKTKKQPLKDRFPGLRSFQASDAELFFGRDTELDQLNKLLHIYRLVLLFGPSGVGKSSLVNTCFNKPGAKAFDPVNIRLNSALERSGGPTKTPLQVVKEALIAHFMELGIMLDEGRIVYDKGSPQLWEYFKLAGLAYQSHFPDRKLVFVFDQFEEFFLHDNQLQDDFIKQLSEAVHERPPRRVLDWASALPVSQRTEQVLEWCKQPESKILLSIRSDKLGLVNRMAVHIPSVLNNRMELRPFARPNALLAIQGPAGLLNDPLKFTSPPILISDEVVSKITAGLTNSFSEIESSFLQIICYYIEQRVKQDAFLRQLSLTDSYRFDAAQFDEVIDINTVLDRFYEEQLGQAESAEARSLIQAVIEDELVVEGQRTSLIKDQLVRKLSQREELIQYMLNARLLREENTTRGVTYELSHDKLIAPVERSRNLRIQREVVEEAKKREAVLLAEATRRDTELAVQKELVTTAQREKRRARLWGSIATGLAILALMALIAVFLMLRQTNTANNKVVNMQASGYYMQNDHFLAFRLWEKAADDLSGSNEKASAQEVLDSRFFFDISGGDNLKRLADGRIAVHNKDNTIMLWQLAGKNEKLRLRWLDDKQHKTIRTAANMLRSPDGRYLAFRDTRYNSVFVFDSQSNETFEIRDSRLSSISAKGRKSRSSSDNAINELKMDFLKNSDFLAFIDATGNIRICDLPGRRVLQLVIRKRVRGFSVNDIKDMCQIPVTGSHLLIKRPFSDTLGVWKINKNYSVTRTMILHGVERVFASVDPNHFFVLQHNRNFLQVPYIETPSDQQVVVSPDVTDMLISPDGAKALVLRVGKELLVFDFKIGKFDRKYQGSKTFRKFDLGAVIPRLNTFVRWNVASTKFSFETARGQVFMVDLSIPRSYYLLNKNKAFPDLQTQDGYNYLISPDGKYCTYIDASGNVVIVDVITEKVLSKIPTYDHSVNYGSLLNLDDIIRFSEEGSKLAVLKIGDNGNNALTLYNTISGKKEAQFNDNKLLGTLFTDSYCQVINDYNSSGGLVMLNGLPRNGDYYRRVYPELSEEDSKRLNGE